MGSGLDAGEVSPRAVRGGSLMKTGKKMLSNVLSKMAPALAAVAVGGVVGRYSNKNAPDADPVTSKVNDVLATGEEPVGEVIAEAGRELLGAAGKAETAAIAAQNEQLINHVNQGFYSIDEAYQRQAEEIARGGQQVQVVDQAVQEITARQLHWNVGAEQAMMGIDSDNRARAAYLEEELTQQRQVVGVLAGNMERLQNQLQLTINAFGQQDQRAIEAYQAVQQLTAARQQQESEIAMQQASMGMTVPGSMALMSGGYNTVGSEASTDYTQWNLAVQPLAYYPVPQDPQPSMDMTGWGLRRVGGRGSHLRKAY